MVVAACVKYEPKPLAPDQSATAFTARTLSDTGLQRLRAQVDSGVPSDVWSPEDLALAAWYFRPELETARRAWKTAQAGEITAGARRPLDAAGAVEKATNTGPFEGSWVVTLGVVFTLELGGKRGARVAAAQARALQAELDARSLAWQIATEARGAAIVLAEAESTAVGWRSRMDLADGVWKRAQSQFEAGATTETDARVVESGFRSAQRETAAAEQTTAEARTDLARAVGIPVPAAGAVRVAPGAESGCRRLSSMPLDSLRGSALRTRYEMGAVLAAYAAAEADLRIQVAKQYPDLSFAPGYSWDQGVQKWVLGWAVQGILLQKNRGPIAEASARREQVASEVDATQQSVIRQVDSAYAACRSASRVLVAAKAVVETRDQVRQMMRAAYDRGETGAESLLTSQLLLAEAIAAERDARLRVGLAGLALEAAAGLWDEGVAAVLPDPLIMASAATPHPGSTP